MHLRDGGWPSRKGAAAAGAMGTCAYFPMLSLPYSIVGLAVTSKGIPCSLTTCLRNMLIAWVVLMPSSEKSFAASSLVCLSMRTVTLTVSMRTSLPRVRAMRRLYARQAVCSWNPSWRDWNMP